MSENIIQQSLQGILDSYINARTNQTFAGHSIRLVFKSIQDAVNSLPALTVHSTLRVKWSIGQGTWAKVPWIALLDERETDTTQRGVYCVYLFRQDMSGVYLTLNQGVTKLIQVDGKLGAYSILRARAQELRPMCTSLIDRGFRLDGAIDLKADPGLGSDYEPSTIAHKFYESGRVPDDKSLAAELDALVSIYQNHLNVTDGKRRNEYHSTQDTRLIMHEFIDSLREMKFSGIQHGAKFVTSLLAKNLVILTGNSGTGKTKIATLFTQWLFQSKASDELSYVSLIPVGADWTDNRHVLGFVNHLRQSQSGLPVYESTPILELILRAESDSKKPSPRPHFLILDEMNLSHVERYFADFLSAMESGRAIPLHTSATPLKSPLGTDVPSELNLPDNLFITGTVNVDETTYMFSPKVLDRANVIEFRVSKDDAKAFLKDGAGGIGEINPAPDGAAEAFLALARKARQKPVPDLVFFTDAQVKTKREALAQSLAGLFDLMHAHKLEFGYRTMNEVLRYAGVDYELEVDRAAWAWETCLDVQILQKILPKLHGSKKRIEPLLVDLAGFCEAGASPVPGKTVFTVRAAGKVVFPESYQKLADMIEAVRRDQFVSFI